MRMEIFSKNSQILEIIGEKVKIISKINFRIKVEIFPDKSHMLKKYTKKWQISNFILKMKIKSKFSLTF
jgi:hypothetical protein